MSCSPFDLRDFHFGELAEPERAQVRQHVRGCVPCGEELRRLEAMQAALLSVREEEIPQRVAFVSDRVYEPSALRRWWTALWNSGPRLAFASAAMLSLAILVHASRPVTVVQQPAPAVDVQAIRAEFDQKLNTAVKTALAQADARNAEETKRQVAAAEQRLTRQHRLEILRATDAFEELQQRTRAVYRASLDFKDPL